MTSKSTSASSNACTYRFISSSLNDIAEERNYDIVIRQQPQCAKMSVVNERDRRPIEPPPILQMQWLDCSAEEIKKYLQTPFYFMVANLIAADDPSNAILPAHEYLSGTTVSSLYRLRDIDNTDGGFFVFGDLAVKKDGQYKLQFSLFEIVDDVVQNRRTMQSDVFTVYVPKRFPGPFEATFLSRTFSDQGVKMRIRKEHRLQSNSGRKRKTDSQHASHSMNDDPDRSYKRHNRHPSSTSTVHSGPTEAQYLQYKSHKSSSSLDANNKPYTAMTTPEPTPANYKTLTNKFRCHHHHPPSPPSSICSPSREVYHSDQIASFSEPLYDAPTPSSRRYSTWTQDATLIPPWSNQHEQRYTTSSSAPSSSWPAPPYTHVETSKPVYPPTSSVPYMPSSYHPSYTPSPPSMPIATVQPPSTSLRDYHMYSEPLRLPMKQRPCTPPPMLADIHQVTTHEKHWGERLPPLRAIMADVLDDRVSRELPAPIPLNPAPIYQPHHLPVIPLDQEHQRHEAANTMLSISHAFAAHC